MPKAFALHAQGFYAVIVPFLWSKRGLKILVATIPNPYHALTSEVLRPYAQGLHPRALVPKAFALVPLASMLSFGILWSKKMFRILVATIPNP